MRIVDLHVKKIAAEYVGQSVAQKVGKYLRVSSKIHHF